MCVHDFIYMHVFMCVFMITSICMCAYHYICTCECVCVSVLLISVCASVYDYICMYVHSIYSICVWCVYDNICMGERECVWAYLYYKIFCRPSNRFQPARWRGGLRR